MTRKYLLAAALLAAGAVLPLLGWAGRIGAGLYQR